MTQDGAQKIGFEESLAELEKRVRRLEAGDVPLEEALRLFEEGVKLAESCHDQLEAAEKRVAQLVRTRQGLGEKDLAENG